jgi:hypoxanthine phosphoribosyltransferase
MRATGKVLYSQDAIAKRIAEMGTRISADFEGKDMAVLGILKGSFVFMADLVRNIRCPLRCGFIDLTPSMGPGRITEMNFTSDFPVEGADLLIVEDILDTGITLAFLKQQLELRKPRMTRIATLLNKPARRRVDIESDYMGFEVPDRYIVGYGLDHGEAYRNLPYLTYVE